MSNTSTIHIKTDFDCKVYDYGQELGTTKADTYFNIELRKGEHELSFVFTGDDSISKTKNYIVENVDCDYKLVVNIVEELCKKAKEYFDSENYSVAYNLLKAAADKGLVIAEYYLGLCYINGYAVNKDINEAINWFTKAANQGNAEAQWQLALYYYDPWDGFTDTSVYWIEKAALLGHAKAQYEIGHFFEFGNHVEKDLIKAMKWYSKASKQGDSRAYYRLGLCYEKGNGVERCYDKAINYYIKASELGNEQAQMHLAFCYGKGEIVDKDTFKKMHWYTEAAIQGNAEAQYALCLDYLEPELKVQNSDRNYNNFIEWFIELEKNQRSEGHYYYSMVFKRIIDLKDSNLFCLIGYHYDLYADEPDYQKAFDWYSKAAEIGSADAEYELGSYYEKGIIVEKDIEKAIGWYMKAIGHGYQEKGYVPNQEKGGYEEALRRLNV